MPLDCPDPLAERRYAYAQAAARDGDWTTAAEVYEQALERAPDWAPAWFALARARRKLGETKAAAAAYRAAIAADPSDEQGAAPRLARMENRPLAALPAAYVAHLFDDYAPDFERHLREELHYVGPELLLAALDALAPGRRFTRALDLGCGSGLMGRALRGRVERLDGVDLSPAMASLARAAGYDAVTVGDFVAYLTAQPPGSADLVVAADALCYAGDLGPVTRAAAAALRPGGMFAFTVESGEAPFALGPGLRFQHSDAHLRACAAGAGLTVAHFAAVATRSEAGEAASGRLAVLAKP